MQYAEPLLDRYEGVAALAERGEAGEKANARRIKTLLESKYPGIAYQSRLRETQQKETERDGPGPYDAANGSFGGAGSRWSRWTNMAGSAFGWATEFASELASADYARRCAEELVEIRTKILASDKHQIAVKIKMDDLYSCAHYLSPVQKQLFAQWVGGRVAALVLESLEDED